MTIRGAESHGGGCASPGVAHPHGARRGHQAAEQPVGRHHRPNRLSLGQMNDALQRIRGEDGFERASGKQKRNPIAK